MGAAGSITAARKERFQQCGCPRAVAYLVNVGGADRSVAVCVCVCGTGNMDMVMEVRRAWVSDFDSSFSLTRADLTRLVSKCPIVQGRVDAEKFTEDTWRVMSNNGRSLCVPVCGGAVCSWLTGCGLWTW